MTQQTISIVDRKVLDFVSDHPLSTASAVAGATCLTQARAHLTLCRLARTARLFETRLPGKGTVYIAYKMGECEGCGVFDHYLVLGLCHNCNERARLYTPELVRLAEVGR